jgi:nucleotide-binding universal stress UspA family protein
MYKHLLFPADGSELSRSFAEQAVRLAVALGAQLTALHVTPLFRPEGLHAHEILREARDDSERARVEANKVLDAVARLAQPAGVACTTVHRVSDKPWQAILEVAAESGCDLVCMGSHGHSGLRALVLGSVTKDVLAHAKVPVLVARPARS